VCVKDCSINSRIWAILSSRSGRDRKTVGLMFEGVRIVAQVAADLTVLEQTLKIAIVLHHFCHFNQSYLNQVITFNALKVKYFHRKESISPLTHSLFPWR
jgi:hypothetical protein